MVTQASRKPDQHVQSSDHCWRRRQWNIRLLMQYIPIDYYQSQRGFSTANSTKRSGAVSRIIYDTRRRFANLNPLLELEVESSIHARRLNFPESPVGILTEVYFLCTLFLSN
jgi:hypothetical protein